ncbi:MAG: hypothetical protein A4E58_00301 [Syntrophorhabdus sp. PtaB.Bin006]|nr:MAG: hypothetical protein A4E58_00301 [Syntrophorhabdus sp. PtaB.Bin006]
MVDLAENFLHADDAGTGYADDDDLFPVDQPFLHILHNRLAVAAFYHHTDLFLQGREIACEVLHAQRVQNDLVDLLRFRNKTRGCVEFVKAFFVAYHHINIFEHFGNNAF